MQILLVGGGSGGHITPLLAVAREIKKKHPKARISYILETGSKFAGLVQGSSDIDEVYTIRAGKFRRYHGESFLKQLLDIPTMILNVRDFFFVLIGLGQSIWRVKTLNPDTVFIKGGFVGVPVGLASALWRVPYITHDSDTTPGLANQIVGKWARLHATGMPEVFYSYPASKMRYVGIPLAERYTLISKSAQQTYRDAIGIPDKALFIAVTGGSLGAQRLNEDVGAVAEHLLKEFPNLYIFHQTGDQDAGLYDHLPEDLHMRVIQKPFVDDLYRYMGAADVIIARAGATTIAEIGALGKASILVPNPILTGGQQPKNAKHIARYNAALIVSESDAANPAHFMRVIRKLLTSKDEREKLGKNLHELIKPDAAKEIARIIEESMSGDQQ